MYALLWVINYFSGLDYFYLLYGGLFRSKSKVQCPCESRLYGEWVAGTFYNQRIHFISGLVCFFLFFFFNLDILGERKHT